MFSHFNAKKHETYSVLTQAHPTFTEAQGYPFFFLDAFSRLYKRVCKSVGPSVGRSHTSWNHAKVPFECQKTMFLWKWLCPLCHDKDIVVSTSTRVFLECACVTLSHRMYDILVEKGKCIYRKKQIFQWRKWWLVTHPQSLILTFIFQIPFCIVYTDMGWHRITLWISEVLMMVPKKV